MTSRMQYAFPLYADWGGEHMMRKRLLLTVTMILMWVGYGYAGLANGSASIVLGQPNFTSNAFGTGPAGINGPNCVAVDVLHNRVFVADTFNNRVLWWNDRTSLTSGKNADGVLGQMDFNSVQANRGATPGTATLFDPYGVYADPDGNLWVADSDNNRVLMFVPPFTNGKDATLVLGQGSFTEREPNRNTGSAGAVTLRRPMSITKDRDNNLWVSDSDNNRVVRYHGPTFTTGQSADIVLGQPSMTDSDSHDANSDSLAETVTAATLYQPQGISADSAGNLWVSDHQNHRFLRYSPPFAIGMNATLVLGQPDFSSGRSNRGTYPSAAGVHCAFTISADTAGNVWAADFANNRILRYAGTLTNGMSAVQVLGQNDFTSIAANRSGTTQPNSLYHPCSVTVDGDGNLWVAEGGSAGGHVGGNNRLLKFSMFKVLSVTPSVCPNIGPYTMTVHGDGMIPVTTVRLVRQGQKDIVATNITLTGETDLQCQLDVSNVSAGYWDMVIGAGSLTVTLSNAVLVTAMRLDSIQPASVLNTGPVDAVLTGANFWQGTRIVLRQTRYPDIAATNVIISSDTASVQCRFDVTGVRTGKWSVILSSGNATAQLTDGFVIHFPSSSVKLIHRDRDEFIGIETEQGEVILDIPVFSFAADLTMSMALPAVLPQCVQQEFCGCGVSASVSTDIDLKAQKDMTMTVTYMPSYVDGRQKNRLAVVFYDTPGSRWIQTHSVSYPSQNRIVSQVRHLSIFLIVERIARPDLTQVVVYPNPYRPNSGGLNDRSALGNGIVFSGLTAGARIKIFTVAGERVNELLDDNGDGLIVWDGTTDTGATAASGVYFYHVGSSGEAVRGRVAIIR